MPRAARSANFRNHLLSDNPQINDVCAVPLKPSAPPPPYPGWILLATILGSSMSFIDTSVVNVALPRIQLDFNADTTHVQWVTEIYTLFLAALQLTGGALADHYGRRRIYAAGIALFTLASMSCGLSTSAGALIASRALQGMGGALMVPTSLAVITATFSGPERGRAIGLWSGFTGISAAIGPVLGGWVVENLSWHWVFFINVPLAIAVLLIVFRFMPESRLTEAHARPDLTGTLLVGFGFGLVVYSLIESTNRGWHDPLILTSLLAGIGALVAFIYAEYRRPDPMIPPAIFHARTFSGANLLTFFLYAALGGTLFFLPFNLIQVQHYTATAAGASLLPVILMLLLLSPRMGEWVHRFGSRRILVIGTLLATLAFFLAALPGVGGSYWTTYFPSILLLGLALAVTVAPLTTTVMGSAPKEYAGIASGLNNAISQIGSLLAIAIFGIIIVNVFARSLDHRLDTRHIPPVVKQDVIAQQKKLAAVQIPPETPAPIAAEVRQTVYKSFMTGFRTLMFCAAGLSLASAIAAWLLIKD